jgi:hypothetical protein
MSRGMDRVAVVLVFRLILGVGLSGLSPLVFKSQFWSDVMCDNGQVATVIYDSGRVSSISNVLEMSFDKDKKLRTCDANATV